MAKNKATFKQMAVATPVLCCSLLTGVALLCWCGVSIYAKTMTIADSDLMVPTMVLQHTPLFINILMLWALFAFTATTADALGLSAATIISRDLVGRFFMKNMDEQTKDKLSVKVGKTCVLLLMPFIAWIAFKQPTFIVNYAYNFSGPGFASILPAVFLGLYWRQSTKEGAWAGTIAGLITLAVTLFYPPLRWPLKIHPVIWSLGANFLVFYVVSLMTQVPAKVAAEFHNVRFDGPYPTGSH
jgi:Na+/proline symporter